MPEEEEEKQENPGLDEQSQEMVADPDEALPEEVDGETAMREMIHYIARVLVEEKDSVQVDSSWRDDRLVVNLKVADSDKGKVIGRNGRVVQAMQSLLRVAATKSNLRVNLDVE